MEAVSDLFVFVEILFVYIFVKFNIVKIGLLILELISSYSKRNSFSPLMPY